MDDTLDAPEVPYPWDTYPHAERHVPADRISHLHVQCLNDSPHLWVDGITYETEQLHCRVTSYEGMQPCPPGSSVTIIIEYDGITMWKDAAAGVISHNIQGVADRITYRERPPPPNISKTSNSP